MNGTHTQLLRDFADRFLSSMRGAAILIDAAGRVVTANGEALALLRCSAAELVGLSHKSLFEAPGLELQEDAPARLLLAATELALVGCHGARVPIAFSGSPLRDERGELIGVVCQCTDLRERKRLELELSHAQKLESVGQLAAGVAHEINTPVQFIGDSVCFLQDAFGEMAELIEHMLPLVRAQESEHGDAGGADLAELESRIDYEFLREEVPGALQRIVQGVGRVASIVRAMKTFAHPGSSEMAVSDLNEAIQTTLTVARNEYKYVADVVLELGEIPEVVCNQGDMNQVLLNLIVNAAHAIESVVQSSGKRGTITVRTRREGEYVWIEVEDSGCGIPRETRERIWDPFFTTKPAGKGTGQGLSIVHRIIVDKHKGSIGFDSEQGRGTTFRIRLPIRGPFGAYGREQVA